MAEEIQTYTLYVTIGVLVVSLGSLAVATILVIVTGRYTRYTREGAQWTKESAQWTRSAAIASIVADFMREYAGQEMLDSLRMLSEFEHQNERMLMPLRAWVDNLREEDDDGPSLARWYAQDIHIGADDARRRVDFFFKRAYHLHLAGHLPLEEFRIVVNRSGQRLLLNVVMPLSIADNFVRISNGEWQRFEREIPRFAWYRDFHRLADAERWGLI